MEIMKNQLNVTFELRRRTVGLCSALMIAISQLIRHGGVMTSVSGAAKIKGWCDPRFAGVRDAFAANFAERGEAGAAACLAVHGTVVADLWGGRAGHGPGRPWQRDTLVNVFSVGKGLIAACAARLVGERRLDADVPVARYWPEFGAAGKQAV